MAGLRQALWGKNERTREAERVFVRNDTVSR